MCSLVVKFAKNAFVYVRQISLGTANSEGRFAVTNKYIAQINRYHNGTAIIKKSRGPMTDPCGTPLQ